MYITGMEVTQAIQNTSNSVLLVKNKRTFVRVYVKSVGPSVAGVTVTRPLPSIGAHPTPAGQPGWYQAHRAHQSQPG